MGEQFTKPNESAPDSANIKRLLLELNENFTSSVAPALENYLASQAADETTSNRLIEAMDSFRDKLDLYGDAAEDEGAQWSVIGLYNILTSARKFVVDNIGINKSPDVPQQLAKLLEMKIILETAAKQ